MAKRSMVAVLFIVPCLGLRKTRDSAEGRRYAPELAPLIAKHGAEAAADPQAESNKCTPFVPTSVGTRYHWVPWVEDCKCNGDKILWGYGPACNPRLSNGFDGKELVMANGGDIKACGCTELTRVAPDVQSCRIAHPEFAADVPQAGSGPCDRYVSGSSRTIRGRFPGVVGELQECQCGVDEVLWGYGPSCDPRWSGGFNAKLVWRANGMDPSACACHSYGAVYEQVQTCLLSANASSTVVAQDLEQ